MAVNIMAKEIMITVDGAEIPCPSTFEWSLQDISAGESGRTDDTTMHKNRVGQKRKLKLAWIAKDWQTTSKILRSFNPEYINVRYPDMMSGTYQTRTFYVGDRTAPVKYWMVGRKMIGQISFNITER